MQSCQSSCTTDLGNELSAQLPCMLAAWAGKGAWSPFRRPSRGPIQHTVIRLPPTLLLVLLVLECRTSACLLLLVPTASMATRSHWVVVASRDHVLKGVEGAFMQVGQGTASKWEGRRGGREGGRE